MIEEYSVAKPEGNFNDLDLYKLSESINSLLFTINSVIYLTDLLLNWFFVYKERYYKNEKVNVDFEELESDIKLLIPKLGDYGVPFNWEKGLDNWLQETYLIDEYFPTYKKIFFALTSFLKSIIKTLKYKIPTK